MENKETTAQVDKMKNLVSKLTGAVQTPPVQVQETNENDKHQNIKTEKKEVTKERKQRKKTNTNASAIGSEIINQIRNIEIDDTTAASIHIRFPANLHSKLLAMKMAKVTAQKFTVFAVMRLMDDPEIKDAIKKILNDLE